MEVSQPGTFNALPVLHAVRCVSRAKCQRGQPSIRLEKHASEASTFSACPACSISSPYLTVRGSPSRPPFVTGNQPITVNGNGVQRPTRTPAARKAAPVQALQVAIAE